MAPAELLMDSMYLFDVICKGSRTSKKRLMLDIAAAREGFRSKVLADFGFMCSHWNIANGLKKSIATFSLQQVLSSGRLDAQPEQSIIRN